MTWTVSVLDAECGRCGVIIPPNQPIALLTSLQLIRCRECAGEVPDESAIDDARHSIEAERASRNTPIPQKKSYARFRPREFSPLSQTAKEFLDRLDGKMKAMND